MKKVIDEVIIGEESFGGSRKQVRIAANYSTDSYAEDATRSTAVFWGVYPHKYGDLYNVFSIDVAKKVVALLSEIIADYDRPKPKLSETLGIGAVVKFGDAGLKIWTQYAKGQWISTDGSFSGVAVPSWIDLGYQEYNNLPLKVINEGVKEDSE